MKNMRQGNRMLYIQQAVKDIRLKEDDNDESIKDIKSDKQNLRELYA